MTLKSFARKVKRQTSFFSCVCLMASMARSVHCLVQKKRNKPGFRFPFWAPHVFFSNLTPPKTGPQNRNPKKRKKSAHWRQQFSGGLQRPLLAGTGSPTCPWRGIFHEHPWHILHSRPTPLRLHEQPHFQVPKNGARNWRREASSSCLLCSSFHLESRLAEFKHTSAIISGDPYYYFQIQYTPWWAQKLTHKRKATKHSRAVGGPPD